ncbi:MAG: hypothetical protein IJH65_13500 [Methanobrevibacter sp.]|nr:hypothetical protein [Methanobrevibacter sp.]
MDKISPEQIYKIFQSFKEATDEKIIALPNDVNIIRDCSLYQLYLIRQLIDETIDDKRKDWRE